MRVVVRPGMEEISTGLYRVVRLLAPAWLVVCRLNIRVYQ